jgi:outer membrane receptor for ferrienterochelin and colicins
MHVFFDTCEAPIFNEGWGFFIHQYSKETCFMRHRWNPIVISILFVCTSALAAEEDTTKIYHENEVVVTATRTAINPADASSSVQVISPEVLQRINGNSVADLLRTINGIYLKEYGAMGATKTLSLRGMSAENILILVDGNSINDPQNGIVDVNLLPLDAVDRVEILYGGASALYGSDASGGVINIMTRRAKEGVHTRVVREVGSYGEQRTAAEVQGRFAGIGIIAGATREFGYDDYPFTVNRQNLTDTVMNRQNSDYNRQQIYGSADMQVLDNIKINASVQYVKFDRGVPGPLTNITETARQNDEVFRSTFGSVWQTSDNVSLNLSGSYTRSNEQYYEPSLYGATDLWYHENYYSINSHLAWSPIVEDQIVIGIDYQGGLLNADGLSYGFPFLMSPTRFQKSVYLSNSYTWQHKAEWFDKVVFYQSVRADYYTDNFGNALSPKLGVNVRVHQPYDIHVRGSWGKNYRVPTFNDLYYPNYSNPNLNPEHSTNIDAGVIGNLEQSGKQTLQVTYFAAFTKDKIAYGTDFLPYNIGKAENKGVEVRYEYHSSDNQFDAFFGVSFIDAINTTSDTEAAYHKQLAYIPKSQGTFGISFLTELGRINVQHSVIGERYNNADNSNLLPAYSLTDVNIVKQISYSGFQLSVRCVVNNVFNANYQVMEGYPMPGRTFRLTLGIDY